MAHAHPPANLDMKALSGRSPWMRLRAGDWRVVFRPLLGPEGAELSRARGEPVGPGTVYVERIINRRDVERIVAALP